jgi:DNA mismatch endonuclease (patch repair protein)
MADVVTAAVRSRMMAGIGGKNTKPELILRKGLHAQGFRFRVHRRDLPGTPDIVLPRYRAALFAHGCFWHGHDCHLFSVPGTRTDFWLAKIARNQEVDRKAQEALALTGWRRGVVWECALKGKTRLPPGNVISICAKWLKSGGEQLEVRGIE